MGKSILSTGFTVLILGCILIPTAPAEAYETYKDPEANCSECHTGFGGPGETLHNAHLAFMSSCTACHVNGTGTTPVPTHEDPPISGKIGCVGCHGRDPATGSGVDWAAGLRLHHTNAGAPADENGLTCVDCHDTDPLPLPEDIEPLYYGDSAVTSQTDSCADNLDNDGDLAYDGDDTDCQPGCTSDADCDDGLFCNGAETCNTSTGQCSEGTPPDCDDGIGCTDDSCDTTTDACVNDPNDANCPDDNMFCNGTEFCDEVADCSSTGDPCPPGETCNEDLDICEFVGCTSDTDCDDGVNCTDDVCNTGTGECSNTANDANCDDGTFCNGAETCDAVNDCQPGTPVECPPGQICNDDLDICEVVGGPIVVEIEVPGAINANNRGKTPIKIEFPDLNGGIQVEIAELFCGGDVSDAMATPEKINVEDDEEDEFVALFKTRDLILVCEDKMMVCIGTLADGTAFMGMDDLRVIRDADGRCGRWNIGKIRW